MKKLLTILLVLSFITMLTACGNSSDAKTESKDATEKATEADVKESVREGKTVALVLDGLGAGINDRGFFQGTWEGITKFSEETGIDSAYYELTDASLDSFIQGVDMAILNGAEIIVVSGAGVIEFMPQIFELYPDMLFLCNEVPVIEPTENSVIYSFDAEESSFLAGIAAVYEGYTKLGVIMPKPLEPVQRLGYGFVQGANWAAAELGIEDVEVKYWYSQTFAPSPDVQAFAASWYENGTELILSANSSVWAAAEASGNVCIGTDTDQTINSESVITSALKLLSSSTYLGLTQWLDGEFPANQRVYFTAKDGATGLAMENSRMIKFTQEVYDDYLDMIINDTDGITSSILIGKDAATPEELWTMMEEKNITFTVFD
jgi:basic membrane protein A